MLNCYLLTQTVILMKDVYEEFFKHKHLTLATFQKTLSFMIIKMKYSLAKWNINIEGFQSIDLLD